MTSPPSHREPPRLATRTLLFTFVAISLVFAGVAGMMFAEFHDRANEAVRANLDAAERVLAAFDARREEDLLVHSRNVAGHRDIGLALRRLQAAPAVTPDEAERFAQLIEGEIHTLVDDTGLDAVVVVDAGRRTVARAGRHARGWPVGRGVVLSGDPGDRRGTAYQALDRVFRVFVLPIRVEGTPVGELHLATALDDRFARTLSDATRAETLVIVDGVIAASSLTAPERGGFASVLGQELPADGVASVSGGTWAVRRLLTLEGVSVVAAAPLGAAQRAAVRDMWLILSTAGIAALLLGALASLWLARTISRPIDELSRTLADMATSRRFDIRLPRPGSSRELDALTDTFNELMRSLSAAEAETRSAYVGAIRALAAALDARDPYTSGHSERVSALSVTIGRHMALPERDIDVLRLGALLHDIGKIGVADNVLRKPGPLTPEEFDAIKTHPRLGSRILRSVPFLAPHLPIVELHHERPDGQGYPHGLAGEEIPMLARIVHVADAFDAMTSARAYRPARPAADAITELWRFAGSQFDTEVVEALVTAWPSVAPAMMGGEWAGSLDTARLRQVVQFSARASERRA